MPLIMASEDGVTVGSWELASDVAELIELAAIVVIVVGVVAALVWGLVVAAQAGTLAGIEKFKRTFARGLLVGLDLLIAADVIKTVTLEGTLESALVLGLLVLIRTFLSWTLILEVEGRWPWQKDLRQQASP